MSCRFRPMSLRASSLILAAGCLLLGPVPARADQVVYFLNGKAITVTKVEKGDKVTILEIEGGGRIGIPTVQIDRIEELSLSPTQLPPPSTQVTAILPPPPKPVQTTAPLPPASAMPAGPGTGGHAMAQNSAQKLAQPLSVGDDPDAPRKPDAAGSPAQPQAQAGSQAIPPGMMGPQMNRANMLGGPGALQRRNRQGNANYGRGRLPAGAYLNPGTPPQGTPANGAPGQQSGAPGQPGGAPGQANGTAPPSGAGAQNGANQGSPSGQSGQPQAAQPPPPPPPVVSSPPPPPPSEPDPGEADANGDSSDDGNSASDDESSSGGDSGH